MESDQLKRVGKHKNIASMVTKGKGMYNKPGKEGTMVNFIVLDYVSEGELICFINKTNPLTEDLGRYCFAQILEGLEHVHKTGIAHRDMKIENILMDSDYTVRLTDFGFAGPLKGRGRDGKLTTNLGTPAYLAPEVIIKQPYYGEKMDIFATAVCLFILLGFNFPFINAQTNDDWYKLICTKKIDEYWSTIAQFIKVSESFSPEFKDLFIKCVSHDPANRPSISEIRQHPWMQIPHISRDQAVEQLKARKAENKTAMEKLKKSSKIASINS